MKLTIKQTIMSALIGTTALVGVSSLAQAGGFAVREQSAEGQGASFAGIAAGGSDLSSMYFNPATITLHEGTNAELNAALILPYSKSKNAVPTVGPVDLVPGSIGLGGTSGNIGKTAIVPSNYFSHQVNENWFLGFTANSPFGLVTEGKTGYAGSTHGVKSDLFMLQAGPTVGYKVNDMFSVAASVRAVYSKVSLTQDVGLAPAFGHAELKGSDWGVNYSLGILFNPTSTTRIGIGYNSGTDLDFDGSLRFTATAFGAALNDTITAKLQTPGTLNVGVRQQIGDKFTALLGFEWANWSSMKRLHAVSKGTGATASYVDFSWKDGFFYSVGGEYKFSEDTTFRAGFAYEDTPVPDSTRGVRIPDQDRFWLSIGASHQVNENLKVSIGYSHIIVKDAKVDLGPGSPFTPVGVRATFKQHVDIVAISGSYKLDHLLAGLFN